MTKSSPSPLLDSATSGGESTPGADGSFTPSVPLYFWLPLIILFLLAWFGCCREGHAMGADYTDTMTYHNKIHGAGYGYEHGDHISAKALVEEVYTTMERWVPLVAEEQGWDVERIVQECRNITNIWLAANAGGDPAMLSWACYKLAEGVYFP